MSRFRFLALGGLYFIGAHFGMSQAAIAADLIPAPIAGVVRPAPVEIGSQWYLRGDVGVGYNNLGDLDISVGGVPFAQSTGVSDFILREKSLSESFFVGAGVGYQYNNFLRFDITGEYRGGSNVYGVDSFRYAFGGTNYSVTNRYTGALSSSVFLANAYFDLGTWCCITPYVGVGVGGANHTVRGFEDSGLVVPDGFSSAPSAGYSSSTSSSSFAWALMAGVTYHASPNLKLEIGYRYLNMGSGPSMLLRDNLTGQAPAQNVVKLKDIDSHDFKIGMRWMLGACCGTAPQAETLIRKY